MVSRIEHKRSSSAHSTISRNRITRFKDTTIFQDIFDEIVLQAINHDMVGGRVLFTDSTHLKANANKHKYTRKTIAQDNQNYIKDLNEAIQEDREEHEKKPLTAKEEVKAEKKIRHSTTDPEMSMILYPILTDWIIKSHDLVFK